MRLLNGKTEKKIVQDSKQVMADLNNLSEKYSTRSVFRSVADPDPGSGVLLTPGSEIRDGKNPDPGTSLIIFTRA
jgi:hypothetical protein